MNPSVRRCPRCQKEVIAGVLCPECGILEGAHDPPLPLPEECPLTESERRRWRLWFWVVLALGPIMVTIYQAVTEAIGNGQLPSLAPFMINDPEWTTLGILGISGLGAAFFLNKSLVRRQPKVELVMMVLFCAVALAFAQGMVVLLCSWFLDGVFR